MILYSKTALITGASRGIGRAIALLFAQEGCDIAFTYFHSDQAAQSLKEEIEGNGVHCLALKADASDYALAHEVVDRVVKEWGKLDILINNAGVTRDALVIRMREEQWDEVMNTNLKSAFNYIQAVSAVMARQRKGSIISMSSVVGLNGNAGQANYAASKAGIVALTKSVAKELGSRNVRVNAIAPGCIETDMTSALSDQNKEAILQMIPMGRVGQPEEVAKVALFLASDMSSYISGQVLQVNGAMA